MEIQFKMPKQWSVYQKIYTLIITDKINQKVLKELMCLHSMEDILALMKIY